MPNKVKQDLTKIFNLPNYVKGKSFAEASKAINNKFKDRKDNISNNTKNELLERLAKAQEYVKINKALETNSKEVPSEDTEMKFGGLAKGLGALNTVTGFAQQAFGNTGVDTSGKSGFVEDQTNDTMQIGGSALKGASLGTSIAPGIGTAVGAVIGGVSGILGNKKEDKAINKANRNAAYIQNNQFDNDFALGGNIPPTVDEKFGEVDFSNFKLGPIPPPINEEDSKDKNSWIDFVRSNNPDSKIVGNILNKDYSSVNAEDLITSPSNESNESEDWLKNNYGELARLAPIISNVTTDLDKPTTAKGSRLDNRYEKDLFDEQTLVNKINNNNINSALAEASGGDLGALRNNILAAELNRDRAISNAYLQGDQINRRQNDAAQRFNLNIDKTNLAANERYLRRKAMDEGAYNTAKNLKRSALFEDIAKLGRELSDKNTVKTMYGYKWNGQYWVNNEGEKITNAEMIALDKKKRAIRNSKNSK